MNEKERNSKTRSAQRMAKILFAEHKLNPITFVGTMHVSVDFDLTKLRRDLSREASKGNIAPLFGKIERSKHGKRSHLHFLWHDNPDKKELRKRIVKLLNRQGIESKRLRLSVQKINRKRHSLPIQDVQEPRYRESKNLH